VGTWQPSLLDVAALGFDATYRGLVRHDLGSGAWVDVVPGWVEGSAQLFETLLADAPWAEHERPMYDRMVVEPRLTTRVWTNPPPVITDMADTLSARYECDLSTVSANLYRDGNDSVAWHGDRVGRRRDHTVVAIVSLGHPRRFLLRPVTGGRSTRFVPASGDLMVLGGTIQRTWQHSVPKVARAGPRISVMFREDY
jgi:alkylated DNA repair dioxygenase AlkB